MVLLVLLEQYNYRQAETGAGDIDVYTDLYVGPPVEKLGAGPTKATDRLREPTIHGVHDCSRQDSAC